MKKIIITILISFGISVHAKTGEIVLSSAIEVSPRDIISLYDIVEARQVNRSTLTSLKEVIIAGKNTNRISREDLTKKLRHLNVRFVLPTEVKLIRTTQKVSRMELERKIKNHLFAACEKCDYRININSIPKTVSSDWELDLNIDLNSKRAVMIPVYSISEPNQKGWITVEIKKYMDVAVLNRDLKVGDVIAEDMLVTDNRLVENADVIDDVQKAVGMQATRFVSAGRAISYRDLKKENVLKRGQLVKAVFGQDEFEVSITAQSEEAGAVGDIVKIKNLDSKKILAAKIEDRGLVRIE